MTERSLHHSSGSFVEQVQLKSKTDKMFGLDKADSSLKPQKQGWLVKKPFKSTSSFSTDKIARKRWFAVKDSFLFWWDSEIKADAGFDTHPRGAMPLGGALIRQLPDRVSIEVRHPVFQSGDSLCLKASDAFEAQEWLEVIQAGMKATWENAMLGFALIDKLKAKGSELEGEKDVALLQAQMEAARLEAEREEAARLAELKNAEAAMHQEEVARVEGTVGQLQKQVSLKEDEHNQEKMAYEEEKRKRERLERELMEAQDALMEIEAAFETFEEHRMRELTKEKLRKEEEARRRQPTLVPPSKEEQAAMVRKIEEEVKRDNESKFKDDAQVRKNVHLLREYFETVSRAHMTRRQGLTVKKQ